MAALREVPAVFFQESFELDRPEVWGLLGDAATDEGRQEALEKLGHYLVGGRAGGGRRALRGREGKGKARMQSGKPSKSMAGQWKEHPACHALSLAPELVAGAPARRRF